MNQYIKYILFFFNFSFLYCKENTQTLSPEDITKIAEKCFALYLDYQKAILNASSESIKQTLELNLMQKKVFRDILPLAVTAIIPIIYLCITSNVNPFKSISKITLKKNTLAIDTTLKDKSLQENIKDIVFDEDKKFFLFYGPPGSGKTYGSKILAANNNAYLHQPTNNMFNVEAYAGTDILKIKVFLENLQKLATENPKQKIFVLIDEVDSMGK
jgi:SpoVK/Ycf46/Vps4 family AAA+-type ATPase